MDDDVGVGYELVDRGAVEDVALAVLRLLQPSSPGSKGRRAIASTRPTSGVRSSARTNGIADLARRAGDGDGELGGAVGHEPSLFPERLGGLGREVAACLRFAAVARLVARGRGDRLDNEGRDQQRHAHQRRADQEGEVVAGVERGVGRGRRRRAGASVRSVASVASTASPIAPPTWMVVLTRPEASPASLWVAPDIASVISAGNARPAPAPSSSITGRTSVDVVAVDRRRREQQQPAGR